MNKYLVRVILTTLSIHCTHVYCETITASQFNQVYSCQNPFRPNESSTIILDEDIVINNPDGCLLIAAGPGFNVTTDSVTITSNNSHVFKVGTSSRWIIGVNILFNGNAQLQLLPGAVLQFPSFAPTVRMSGNSVFIPMES